MAENQDDSISTSVATSTKLSESEDYGLRYIGGYVCQKLYRSLRKSKKLEGRDRTDGSRLFVCYSRHKQLFSAR
jgi:hypothetical protein